MARWSVSVGSPDQIRAQVSQVDRVDRVGARAAERSWTTVDRQHAWISDGARHASVLRLYFVGRTSRDVGSRPRPQCPRSRTDHRKPILVGSHGAEELARLVRHQVTRCRLRARTWTVSTESRSRTITMSSRGSKSAGVDGPMRLSPGAQLRAARSRLRARRRSRTRPSKRSAGQP